MQQEVMQAWKNLQEAEKDSQQRVWEVVFQLHRLAAHPHPTGLWEVPELILFLPEEFLLLYLLPLAVAIVCCLTKHHPHIAVLSRYSQCANDPPDKVQVSDIHFSRYIFSMADGHNIHRGTSASLREVRSNFCHNRKYKPAVINKQRYAALSGPGMVA